MNAIIKRQFFLISAIQDIIFFCILTAVSLFFVSFAFNASFIDPGYPDWIIHAFRVKLLEEAGFLSWTHKWSNGINIWQSYQFVPQMLAAGFAMIFKVEPNRAVMLLSIGLFVMTRWNLYIVLRLLKFSPFTAFIATSLSFTIAQFWHGFNEYSMLLAFALFPIYIYLWVQYLRNTIHYLFPFLIGFAFYIHPILAFYCLVLWLISLPFSDRKIPSVKLLLEFMVFIVASSHFWLPLILKDSLNLTNDILSTQEFLQLPVLPYSYFGLSLFVIACIIVSFAFIFLPSSKTYFWQKILAAYTMFMIILIVMATHISLPHVLSNTQFTRGAVFVGFTAIISSALLIERLFKKKFHALIWFFTGIILLSYIQGTWYASIYSGVPVEEYNEPVSTFAKLNPEVDFTSGRIWTPYIDYSSYFTPLNYRFPNSYMTHLESNYLPIRLSGLMHYQQPIDPFPPSSIRRITDYFKLTGVKYIFLEQNDSFAQPFVTTYSDQYTNLGTITLDKSTYIVFETDWEPVNAAIVDTSVAKRLPLFPDDLKTTNYLDQTQLDEYVETITADIYNSANKPVQVSYPTQETVEVTIPDARTSQYLYLNESYSPNWRGSLNNKPVSIRPIGPSFMLIDLGSTTGGGVLKLQHSWNIGIIIAWISIAITGLLAIIVDFVMKKRKVVPVINTKIT